jgi:sugar/nucleoside kinase (ribokinase family)
VARVVDTTGAGDLYAAGVLFGLTQGLELENAGRIGSICAAEVISHYGARPETSLSVLVKEKLG